MVDILARITEMRLQRNWTEYALSEQADVPQSTISSWYNQNKLPSLGSIDKIAGAFKVPVSQLFAEGDLVELTSTQLEIITKWATLDEEKQAAVKRIIELL